MADLDRSRPSAAAQIIKVPVVAAKAVAAKAVAAPSERTPWSKEERAVSKPAPTLPVPRPFKRCRTVTSYEFLEKVGEGTFGEVHKARNKSAPYDIVALKKVLMKNEKEGFPITALREIKILKLLEHENVLNLKEICYSDDVTDNGIYLVFEFMEHDLGGLLNRDVRFNAREIMCITKQMFDGLHYMHKCKILHRDMKVANLLMSRDGVLKIADFGLARGWDAKNSKYTSTVCTRWYRPPEILLGQRNYTYAIDIWGAGCIVAELFVGRPILQGGVPTAKNERDHDIDQYDKICQLCGTPSEESWPGFSKLPEANFITPKEERRPTIRKAFNSRLQGVKSAAPFIEKLLRLDPMKRLTADKALDDPFFWGNDGQDPMPCKPSEIRKFPSSHEYLVQKKPRRPHQQPRPAQHQRPNGRPSGKDGGGSHTAGGSGQPWAFQKEGGGRGRGGWRRGGAEPRDPARTGQQHVRGAGGRPAYSRPRESVWTKQPSTTTPGSSPASVSSDNSVAPKKGGSVWARDGGGAAPKKGGSVWARKGSAAGWSAGGQKRSWGGVHNGPDPKRGRVQGRPWGSDSAAAAAAAAKAAASGGRVHDRIGSGSAAAAAGAAAVAKAAATGGRVHDRIGERPATQQGLNMGKDAGPGR